MTQRGGGLKGPEPNDELAQETWMCAGQPPPQVRGEPWLG